HPYTNNDPSVTATLEEFARATVKLNVIMQTDFGGHGVFAGNTLQNTVHYLRSPLLHDFEGVLKGQTAVLCGAGPSLSANLSMLRDYQDRVFVFAVSSALKRVQAAGVRVDATAVVDYSHLSKRYFDGLSSYPPLWSQAGAHPSVFNAYQGKILLAERDDYHVLLNDVVKHRGGEVDESTNVSHHGFQVLKLLGASTIIMIGMDQAYSNHVTHVAGAAMYDEMVASSGRFTTLENQELIIVSCGEDRVSAGKDVNGVDLLTDRQMNESAITFESIFAKLQGAKAINATGAGRRLRGAEDMPFEKAMESYAQAAVDLSEYHKRLERPADATKKDLSKGRARLDVKRRFGQRIESALKRLAVAYEKAAENIRAGKSGDVNSAADALAAIAREDEHLYAALSRYASADMFERKRALRDVAEADLPDNERHAQTAEIEGNYAKAFRIGVSRWLKHAERGLRAITNVIEGKEPSLGLEDEAEKQEDSPEGNKTIDAYIEFRDDEASALAFVGDEEYSPLAQALGVLRASKRIRRIVVNRARSELPQWLEDEGIVFVQGSTKPDIPRRHDAKRLMAWNAVGTLRGVTM
ncbi:MAG: motility associated factor glycosyltransferase family protein, partial [Planctomycetes bacterium]|nr:motility associated factor glycosyltransferase family protein [Planctomycetota bacterium]